MLKSQIVAVGVVLWATRRNCCRLIMSQEELVIGEAHGTGNNDQF
jgi:hypothetical protein